jgi:hypothetical protein
MFAYGVASSLADESILYGWQRIIEMMETVEYGYSIWQQCTTAFFPGCKYIYHFQTDPVIT